MKKGVKLTGVLVLFCNVFVNAGSITIADNGLAKAVITIDKNADKSEMNAAKELSNFLEQVTGAKFEITNKASAVKSNIFIGPEMAKKASPDFTIDGLGTDGIVIRTVGNDLILAGGKPRGTLYAVYTFLEDYAGCRWWTSTASTIPHKPTFKAENLNVKYVPVFEYRDIYTKDSIDPDWSVRNKRVGLAPGPYYRDSSLTRGGCLNWWPTPHSFYIVLPPEKYLTDHPEWYSLINGERTATPTDHASLCLSNKEMWKQYAIDTIPETKRDPFAVYACVGAPDDSGFPNMCQCADCIASRTAPNPPSELLTQFTNYIAAVYAKELPHFKILLTAYSHYRKPPVASKPAENVVVLLCSIEASGSVPISHERNQTFREDMFGWLKISKSVYIYNYGINFSYEFVPHPNLRAIGADIKFFAENGIKGIFTESGANSVSTTSGYGMEPIRTWMLAKLMWNPSLNVRDLIEEFVSGYYGPGDKFLLAYIDTMHDAVEASGDWLGIGKPTAVPSAKFLSIETLDKSWSHLKKAEAAVQNNKTFLSRVQAAQLPVLYTFMVRWQELKYDAMCRGIEWPIDNSIQAVYDYFIKVAEENNINVCPRTTQKELNESLQKVLNKANQQY